MILKYMYCAAKWGKGTSVCWNYCLDLQINNGEYDLLITVFLNRLVDQLCILTVYALHIPYYAVYVCIHVCVCAMINFCALHCSLNKQMTLVSSVLHLS